MPHSRPPAIRRAKTSSQPGGTEGTTTVFFFNDTAPTEIYTLSLHAALPIWRRPLVLMVRETPLHLGHLRTMTALAEMGAIIAPPLPAFYAQPASIAEMADQSVGRALDL